MDFINCFPAGTSIINNTLYVIISFEKQINYDIDGISLDKNFQLVIKH